MNKRKFITGSGVEIDLSTDNNCDIKYVTKKGVEIDLSDEDMFAITEMGIIYEIQAAIEALDGSGNWSDKLHEMLLERSRFQFWDVLWDDFKRDSIRMGIRSIYENIDELREIGEFPEEVLDEFEELEIADFADSLCKNDDWF